MQTLQISDQAANHLNDMAQQEHVTSAEFIERLIEKHRKEQAKQCELKKFFTPYQKDMTGFKFDREDANAR
jgi:predicted CopG family antitoxin